MRKFFTLTITLFVLLLASCGKTGGQKPNGGGTEIYKVENLSQYVFVDTQSNAMNASDVMKDLKNAISEATGISLKSEAAFKNNKYEILVGTTNRKESIEAANGLGYFDYVIKHTDSKIVITAGSGEALLEAAELIKREFIDAEAKALYLPEDYSHIYKYPVEKLSVGGADISEFKIFNGSMAKEEEITEAFRLAIKAELPFAEEMTEGEHYIILDASSYKYEDYSITVEDGDIRLHGSARSIYGALDAFGSKFLASLQSDEYDLTSSDKYSGSIEKKDIYSKDALLSVLGTVYDDKDKIIIGEQSRGQLNAVRDSIKGFENATGGERPGILGFDFSTTPGGLFSDVGIDMKVKLSYMLCDMIDFAAEGGILTFSAHWCNPSDNYPDENNLYRGNLGYDNSKEGYEKAFTDLLTSGTDYNERFLKLLDEEAEIFAALKDNGVPVIWRPLHETNGDWFWFCVRQNAYTLDASYITDIWKYVYNYFDEKGLDNLLWMYAPNYSANVEDDKNQRPMSTLYLYPGDEYCDLVGVDWYTAGGLEILEGDSYLRLTDYSRKVGALTEFGAAGDALGDDGTADPEKYSSMNAFNDLIRLREEGYSFAYLMTWGGSWSISQMGEGTALMEQEMTLGQAEVKELFDSLQ